MASFLAKGVFMFYRVETKTSEAGTVAWVPAVPELAPTPVENDDDAVKKLSKILPRVLQEHYRKEKRCAPFPSDYVDGELAIRVPLKARAKMLLWNYMVTNRYRIADLAKLLKISQTQAQRLVDLDRDGASIDAIEDALYAIDAYFELKLERFE